ncbi:MAG: gamma-glutamyl-gamma-aminobutyrate hydrolase family protein [Thermoflexales bacterium]|nr:gamma-glutamyl-gamma-aminobutyrate hydrolase family protein [Thermoflexales bacterium]
MKRPLIGITTHSASDPIRAELDTLVDGIVTGIERAGGLPVLIPYNLPDTAVRAIAATLDGVLLSGGGDIDPARYGAEREPETGGIDDGRDRAELTLIRTLVDEARPFFGICRGAQIVNVALGGTMHQEVSRAPGADKHTFYPGYPDDHLAHPVQIAEESHLSRILGKPILSVNSLHHQAIGKIGAGVRATALAPDGVVEAIEVEDHPFGMGVQWHPEAMLHHPEMQSLFDGFVAACAGRSLDNLKG